MSTKVIYKYTLAPEPGLQTLCMKPGQILDVQAQRNTLVLWSSHDPEARPVPHTFLLVLTGQPVAIPAQFAFLKTVQLDDGDYVIHCFYEKA